MKFPNFVQQTQMVKWVAETTMRPFARDLDENEHACPHEFIQTMWPILRDQQKPHWINCNARMMAMAKEAQSSQYPYPRYDAPD
ncbi:MAG: hypothetical protein H6672_17730 [Anaerolineaceae bacterium]|nr:hypothetical protein [Anaerolineaceae bacterium]